MPDGVSVSLCMITRNEEHFLASCINSVHHIVDEIIVVDTGSTDKTREIAARYGARVFFFPWQDDFAAARNYSLAQATGEWILVLDADEILEPVQAEAFARLLARPEVEGYFFNIRSYLGHGEAVVHDYVVRLFRNKPVYRFEGAIHEQVAGAIKRQNGGKGLAFADLVIHHFGYLNRQAQTKNKRQRNISIILRALRDNPKDPFLLYSVGTEYLQADEFTKGIAFLEKALTLMRGGEGYFRDVLITLGAGLLRAGRVDRLTSFLDKALQMLPNDPDLHLLKGMAALAKEAYAAAAVELRQALAGCNQTLPPHRILTLLGDTCNILGQYADAENAYLEALRLAPRTLYPLTQILSLKQKGKSRLGWDALSRFAPPTIKKALREELINLGEFSLALILSLLTVIEVACAEHTGEAVQVCTEYQLILNQCRSLPEPWGAYLYAGAREMQFCAEAARQGFSLPWFSPSERLRKLALADLELVVRELLPAWKPTPPSQIT